MYNLSQLIALQSSLLAANLDNYAGVDEEAQAKQINVALDWISRFIYITNERIVLTLAANEPIQNLRADGVCSQRVVAPRTIVINGAPLRICGGERYGLWSRAEIEAHQPTWRTDPSGTPTKAAFLGNGRLLLHPAPSTTVAAYTSNYLSATVLAPPLVDDEDVPDIPEELHFAVAQVAAVMAAENSAMDAEGWKALETLRNSPVALLRTVRDENIRANAPWGSTSSSSAYLAC